MWYKVELVGNQNTFAIVPVTTSAPSVDWKFKPNDAISFILIMTFRARKFLV